MGATPVLQKGFLRALSNTQFRLQTYIPLEWCHAFFQSIEGLMTVTCWARGMQYQGSIAHCSGMPAKLTSLESR
jgi:hypothetical protein